ncbi:MAG: potassium channel family protein [Candidatus Aminicenantes bacterium]|nr:potassium channel family protein [Candidatus Aminicenantes bacterium]
MDYLYFSIVTFTTLGYGDIRPLPAPWARMVASGEAFIGAFMIALFVWTLARRYVAR